MDLTLDAIWERLANPDRFKGEFHEGEEPPAAASELEGDDDDPELARLRTLEREVAALLADEDADDDGFAFYIG